MIVDVIIAINIAVIFNIGEMQTFLYKFQCLKNTDSSPSTCAHGYISALSHFETDFITYLNALFIYVIISLYMYM